MKIIAVLTLLMLLACAPTKQPLTMSATGFAQIDPRATTAGAGRHQALKLAEIKARQQLLDHLNMYRVDNKMPLEQLVAVDPFTRAVCEDTIRAARISDRTITEDGAVSVKVELDMDLLSSMLGAPVVGTAETTGTTQTQR